MTTRLKTVCSLIEKTPSFIDVGCDHGYVVKYVSDRALADRITACDISMPSLQKARRLLGDDNGVEFVCADGADVAKGFDTVLVAGMGGKEIISVIKNCEPSVFILSPQSHVREVRISLLERDYDIIYDKTVRDGRKYYDIIKAVCGGGVAKLKDASDIMLSYGMFVHMPDTTLKERLTKAYTAVCSYPPTEENKAKAHEIKEALKWQSL